MALSRKLQNQGYHNAVWSEYSDALLPIAAWPGGYPLVYLVQTAAHRDTYEVCGDCARAIAYMRDAIVVDVQAHYEGSPIDCEECGIPI